MPETPTDVHAPADGAPNASAPVGEAVAPTTAASADDPGAAARGPAGGLGAAGPAPADGPFLIPSLDGIRALSFFIVYLSHACLWGIVPGYFGLSLFFFLSGYLITTLLRLEFDKTGDISLKQFYLRRAFRIFPPFYLVLGVAAFLTYIGFMQGSVSLNALTAQAFHVTNYYIILKGWWDGISPGTWVYWSLAIEEHFYLVFPVLYLWMRKVGMTRDRQALTLFALCMLVLVWRCVLYLALDASKERVYLATDTRVDSIVVGCILAIWRNPVLDRGSWNDRKLGYAWLPIGFVMVLVSLAIRVPRFEQTLRYSLQSFGLLPFFVAAICWHQRWPFRLLNNGVVRYVGFLSYSLYLMHTAVIWAVDRHVHLDLFARVGVELALLLVFSSLIYKYVEKPSAKMRRSLSRLMDQRKAAADAERSPNPIAA